MKIVALTGLALALLLPSAATAQPGALTQPAGAAGCVSESSSGGTCADGYGLEGATALAISPDGQNVYVVAPSTQSLAVFARDAATGALTEQACFTLWAAGGDPECARIPRGLSNPVAITVTDDGRSVYVANLTHEVTVFARDPQTGALSQPPTQPCVGSWMLPGCPGSATALAAAEDVVSVGRDVYVAAGGDQAIGELRRDPATSILSQPAERPACISRDGMASSTTGKAADCTHASLAFSQPTALALSPGATLLWTVDRGGHALWSFPRDPVSGVLGAAWCLSPIPGACGSTVAHGMQAPYDVAASGDGADVYVTSTVPGSVAALRSTPAGALSQASNGARYACVTNDGSDGCVQGRALAGAESVVVAPDGRNVYVAAVAAGAVDAFERNPATGGLHQLDGADGCLTYDGAGGICEQGRLLEGVHRLVVSPDGRHLYAASYNRSAVLTFAREQPPVPTPTPEPPAPPAGAAEPGPAAPPAVVEVPAAVPAITAFTASPRRFRTSSSTRLRLTLSAPATVTVTLKRRGHHKTLRTLTARPGTRSLRLSGRRLKPGRYVARAAIAGGGGRSRTVTLVVRA